MNELNEEVNTQEAKIDEYLLIPQKEDEKKDDNFDQNIYPVFINNPLLNDKQENNKTNTSKYHWFNFLAKILMEQFSRLVNVYFLVIAVLQSIKEVSYSGGSPVILLPLSFVISLNGLKDLYEDFKRKKSDRAENNSKCLIYNNTTQNFETKKWSQIKLGDIIKVNNNEQFPADLILLSSSDENGICYVETKNIDGETNLKFQEANENLHKKIKNNENILSTIKCVCVTKQPNEFIYKFDATLYETDELGNIIDKNNCILLNKKQFLLKGCYLRQTDYIIGVAIYIGQHTKSMINSPNLKSKHSSVEMNMNKYVIYIFLIQVCLSAIMSIFYIILYHTGFNEYKDYIYPDHKKKENIFRTFLIITFTWVIVCTNFVPISLLVTMETIKFVQGMFMEFDIDMYSKKDMSGCKVQTSTLNEELGQIKYVFSDKTGTLTKNYMTFKMMSIGNDIYGDEENNNDRINNNEIIENSDINNNINTNIDSNINNNINIDKDKNDKELKDKYGSITNVNFYDKNNKFKNVLISENSRKNNLIHEFMLCLSLCNSVIIDTKEKEKNGNINYQGSSPDEISLVYFARSQNYILSNRAIDKTITLIINDEEKQYILLNTLEYSSERKRMSVIIKNPEGKIILYVKGADSIIEKLLSNKSKISDIYTSTIHNLDIFAKKGLRTLMLAYKELSEDEYNVWNNKLEELNKNINHTDEDINLLYDEMEKELNVLGATAIEDQLQDDVDKTIKSMMDTGMKVWMLTGDKLDTAKNIAISCKLFDEKMKIYEIKNYESLEKLKLSLISIIRQEDFYNENIIKGLLISSDILEIIFQNEMLLNAFYGICIKCLSVVCCRVSPKQKAQLVNLIRVTGNSITMAVGDGANDVGMITEANVGVGIEGKEGTQAARASDYSIKEFSHLTKLLFFHGRECYRRNCWVILYNFYKNILFVTPMIYSGIISLFSGTTIYDPWIYQFYNIFYSFLPCFWFGIYNYEFEKEELVNNPKYYIQGIYKKLFHIKRFLKSIILGFIEAGIIFIISNFWFNKGNNDGTTNDFYAIASVTYAAVVFISNLKAILDTSIHEIISISCVILGIIAYFLSVFVYSSDYILSKEIIIKSYILDNITNIVFNNKFFLCVFASCTICYFLEVVCKKYPILFGWVIEGENLLPYKEINNDKEFFQHIGNYEGEELLSAYSKASSHSSLGERIKD